MIKLIKVALFTTVLIAAGLLFMYDLKPLPVAGAAATQSCTPNGAKCTDDCPTPPDFATAGHCADKCPNQTDTLLGYDQTTGAAICKHGTCPAPSFERGFDKETGQVICGTVTGCPYGDSIPLGTECDKAAANQANISPAEDPTPSDTTFAGK